MTAAPPKKQTVLLLKLHFPFEYGLFMAFNLLDLFVTMLIIQQGGGEANPIAKWFIFLGGKSAFVAFKIVLMLVVIALCEVVARARPTAARLVIWFGILAVGAVAVTSALNYYRVLSSGAAM